MMTVKTKTNANTAPIILSIATLIAAVCTGIGVLAAANTAARNARLAENVARDAVTRAAAVEVKVGEIHEYTNSKLTQAQKEVSDLKEAVRRLEADKQKK